MLKTLALAGAVAMLASTASAFTISPGSTLSEGSSTSLTGETSLLFNVSFLDTADGAGSFSFDFTNDGTRDANLNILGTVLQLGIDFAPGVTMSVSDGSSISFATGEDSTKRLYTRLGVGESTTLTVDYGDSILEQGRIAGFAFISVGVDATPVPVPAAGGLMALGLAGLAVMRRRKA